MRGRVIAVVALAFVTASCDAGRGAEAGADGHLRVERETKTPSTIMDEPGRADYCPADSVLSIIAIGHNRAGGFAARTVLPLRGPTVFGVQPVLGGAGTATAAFRLVSGSAKLGAGGQIRLEPGRSLSGDFDVTVPDTGTALVHFKGTLSGIPLSSRPPASCPRT